MSIGLRCMKPEIRLPMNPQERCILVTAAEGFQRRGAVGGAKKTRDEQGQETCLDQRLLRDLLGPQKLLEAIVKQKKGTRYPKESEVTLEHEAVVFVRATPNAFLIAIDRLKKEAGSKGRKRKAPDSTGSIAEGDE